MNKYLDWSLQGLVEAGVALLEQHETAERQAEEARQVARQVELLEAWQDFWEQVRSLLPESLFEFVHSQKDWFKPSSSEDLTIEIPEYAVIRFRVYGDGNGNFTLGNGLTVQGCDAQEQPSRYSEPCLSWMDGYARSFTWSELPMALAFAKREYSRWAAAHGQFEFLQATYEIEEREREKAREAKEAERQAARSWAEQLEDLLDLMIERKVRKMHFEEEV